MQPGSSEVQGPGMAGIRNEGTTCYLNSVRSLPGALLRSLPGALFACSVLTFCPHDLPWLCCTGAFGRGDCIIAW